MFKVGDAIKWMCPLDNDYTYGEITALTEIVDTVTKLDGKVDKETLLSLLPFIDNPKEVLEKLEADKERDRQSTDPYSTQNITEDSNNLFPNLNAQNSSQEALNAQGATIPQPEQ